MRPHNWERFSFGTWLQNAAPRLHRNKLATALANKLARIAWSVLRNEKAFDAHPSRGDGDLNALIHEFATEKMHGTDR